MKTKLFVYGTLKRGRHLCRAYELETKAKFLEEDSVRGELYSLGWYPIMFENGKFVDDVPGEVFLVPDDIYRTIKEMEEAAGYATKTVKTKNGHEVRAFYHKDESLRIPRNRIKEF